MRGIRMSSNRMITIDEVKQYIKTLKAKDPRPQSINLFNFQKICLDFLASYAAALYAQISEANSLEISDFHLRLVNFVSSVSLHNNDNANNLRDYRSWLQMAEIISEVTDLGVYKTIYEKLEAIESALSTDELYANDLILAHMNLRTEFDSLRTKITTTRDVELRSLEDLTIEQYREQIAALEEKLEASQLECQRLRAYIKNTETLATQSQRPGSPRLHKPADTREPDVSSQNVARLGNN